MGRASNPARLLAAAPPACLRLQDEELEERLDASVKRILAHNRHLAEELRLHVQVEGAKPAVLGVVSARQRPRACWAGSPRPVHSHPHLLPATLAEGCKI
jgi:hypothetical protein